MHVDTFTIFSIFHIIFSWTDVTISFFCIFRRENIFHIINRNIKKPIYHTYNIDSMWLTCGSSVNAGVIINFSSYNAVPISSSSIKKRGLVKEAYIYILRFKRRQKSIFYSSILIQKILY